MSENAEGPTGEALQAWAEHYVAPKSAEAFAEHLRHAWDECEPDGDRTLGESSGPGPSEVF